MRGHALLLVASMALLATPLHGPAAATDGPDANLAYLRGAAWEAGIVPAPELDAKLAEFARAAADTDLRAVLEGRSTVPPLLAGRYVGGVEIFCITFFGNCPPPQLTELSSIACEQLAPPGPLGMPVVTPRHPRIHVTNAFPIYYALLLTNVALGLQPQFVSLQDGGTFVGSGCVLLDDGWIVDYRGTGVLLVGV